MENITGDIFNICTDLTPEITELESGGLCDVKHSSCSTVKVFGKGFRSTFELKCEVMKEKVKCFLIFYLFRLGVFGCSSVQVSPFCVGGRW